MLGSVLTQSLCFCLCVCVKPPLKPKEWKLLPGELECQQGPLRLTLPQLLAVLLGCQPTLMSMPAVAPSRACYHWTPCSPTGYGVNKLPTPWKLDILPKLSSIHPFRNYSLNVNDMPDNTGTPVSQDILVLVPSPVQTSSSEIHFVWTCYDFKTFCFL